MTAALGTVPTWDLSDLYSGLADPQIAADLAQTAREAATFKTTWAGKLSTGGTAEALFQAITAYEAIGERLSKVLSYAGLLFAANMDGEGVAAFYQDSQEQATAIQQDLLFFELDICQLDDAMLSTWQQQDATLGRYASWLESVRVFRPHQLSETQEQLLHEKNLTSRSAWTRLFDETMAALRFPFRGEELTEAQLLHILGTNPDRAKRQEAGEIFAKTLEQNSKLFALITNTLAKDKEIDDRWRRYPSPLASRNLSNRIDDATVEALVSAVRKNYANLSHRYYALKAKWLGLEKLEYWDRNAPLPNTDARLFPWEEAVERVLGAYHRFSPRLADLGKTFFDKRWIDAETRTGKDSGAFAHPVVPSVHPYLLLNYQGKPRDIMTLAHELGHGVHQVLAASNGYLLSHTPLTLAETASVFGEMLTFQSLLADTTDPQARKALLASKVEDMLNTVVRQIAFHTFETNVHQRRKQGELSVEALGDIWMDVQRESLGDAIHLRPEYRYFWSYIPHFIHSPFYVYAYAFGDCLVNSLYAVYEESSASFAERYLEMLAAGGTKLYDEALLPFGLDAKNPAFWEGGLRVVMRFIEELETL
jgi:oligoendopeptidase F